MRKTNYLFKRGDVWLGTNGKDHGRRPYIIVSNNRINRTSDYVICCPLTSVRKKKLDSHAIIRTNDINISRYKESTILTEQMQTLKKDNLYEYMMTLDQDEIRDLNMSIIYTVGSD